MDFKNNATLMQALRGGNEDAYKYLMRTFNQRLLGYAISLVNDKTLAQDIVQNVYLNTWRYRNKLNSDFPIKSFLFKSVYNEFVNQYKREKLMIPLEQTYHKVLHEIVETYTYEDIEILMKRVHEEIESLPKKSKEVFVLSKKEGLTNIEIAEYLNISIKTVEAHITKSFSLLRKKLGSQIDMYFILLFKLNRYTCS